MVLRERQVRTHGPGPRPDTPVQPCTHQLSLSHANGAFQTPIEPFTLRYGLAHIRRAFYTPTEPVTHTVVFHAPVEPLGVTRSNAWTRSSSRHARTAFHTLPQGYLLLMSEVPMYGALSYERVARYGCVRTRCAFHTPVRPCPCGRVQASPPNHHDDKMDSDQ